MATALPNEDTWAEARTQQKTLDDERFASRKETLDEFEAGNPLYDNTNTGGGGGPTNPLDLSGANPAAAAMADLATLKADATVGDGGTSAPAAFGTGEFITLADGSKASYDGSAWSAGAAAKAADPNDLSGANAAAAAMADLATLKADATVGDGGTSAPTAFTTGQFITLADASKASYDGSVWTAGAAA